QGEPEAGVASGRFDERTARLDLAGALGRLDQVQADSILDRAAGILVLELQEQLARSGIQMRRGHERRVADHLQHVAESLSWHGGPSLEGRLYRRDRERPAASPAVAANVPGRAA